MVKGKMLGLCHRPFAPQAGADCIAHVCGENRVFRIVLMVTCAVNGTVEVKARCIDGTLLCIEAVFTHEFAFALNQFFVEGCSNHRLCGIRWHHICAKLVVLCGKICLIFVVGGPAYIVTRNLVARVAERSVIAVNSCKLNGIDILQVIAGF